MKKLTKKQRVKRREKCEQAGIIRIMLLRSGAASSSEIEEMRSAVLSGDCPLCAESGFKSIANHFQSMHGILSRDVRDMLGFTYTESICSPDLSERLAEINSHKVPSALGRADLSRRKYSARGKEIRNKNLAPPLTWVTKDVLRENGRKAGAKRKGCAPWNKTDQHGTRAMFRQGCRCALCDKANKDYWKVLNAQRAKAHG
jgi:hypothetical protein